MNSPRAIHESPYERQQIMNTAILFDIDRVTAIAEAHTVEMTEWSNGGYDSYELAVPFEDPAWGSVGVQWSPLDHESWACAPYLRDTSAYKPEQMSSIMRTMEKAAQLAEELNDGKAARVPGDSEWHNETFLTPCIEPHFSSFGKGHEHTIANLRDPFILHERPEIADGVTVIRPDNETNWRLWVEFPEEMTVNDALAYLGALAKGVQDAVYLNGEALAK